MRLRIRSSMPRMAYMNVAIRMSATSVGMLRLGRTRSYISSIKIAPVSIKRLLIPLNSPIEMNALRHDISTVAISDWVAALREEKLRADIDDGFLQRTFLPRLHLPARDLDFLKSGRIDD